MQGIANRKLSEIRITKPYAVFDGRLHDLEPSEDEIQNALDNDKLEEREFSGDGQNALAEEWSKRANGDAEEFYRLQRLFHAERIARFVKHGWTNPIDIKKDGELVDGGHRYRAARFLKRDEIEVRIVE